MDKNERELPEILGSREVFRGRIFEVAVDVVREANQTYTREVVRHQGGASVVALFPDETVALVRQYRHPPALYLLELPAGRIENGERPEACAARELEEELGVRARSLEFLSAFYTTPGFCAERLWIYLATDLHESAQNLEEDEIVEVVRLPLRRALELIATGEIEDAKTIIGLLLTAERLGRETSAALAPRAPHTD